MKKNFLILVCLLLIIFIISIPVLAADTDKDDSSKLNPLNLIKMIIGWANGLYSTFIGSIRAKIDGLINKVDLKTAGHNLIVIFVAISLFAKYSKVDDLSLGRIIPPIFFGAMGIAIINNLELIFSFSESLTNTLVQGNVYSEFIPEDLIVENVKEFTDKMEFSISGILNTVGAIFFYIIYLLISIVGLIGSIVATAYVGLIEIKLMLLRWIAPVMLAGFGSKYTADFSKSFVLQVVKTSLKLVYLNAVVAIFLDLISGTSSIPVFLVSIVGIIVGIFIGPETIFRFLATS